MYCQDVSSFGNTPVKCVIFQQGASTSSYSVEWRICNLKFVKSALCIVKMCQLSAIHLSRCVIFQQGALTSTCSVEWCICYLKFAKSAFYILSRCDIFRQYTCQDVSSFGRKV